MRTGEKSGETATQEPLKIVLEIEGGVIHAAHAAEPVQLLILDGDIDGAEEEELREIGGELRRASLLRAGRSEELEALWGEAMGSEASGSEVTGSKEAQHEG